MSAPRTHADYSWPAYLAKGCECVGKLLVRKALGHPRALKAAAVWGALKAGKAVATWYVPSGAVLELDLEQVKFVSHGLTPLARMSDPAAETVQTLVDALAVAAADSRVAGLVVRMGNNTTLGAHFMTSARVELLLGAFARFRAAGKLTVAYAECVGEGHNVGALQAYYLASAFEHFYLAPCGTLGLTDASCETMFVRRALEKVGVEPQLFARKEYKNFVNMFTETGLTDAHREALTAIVDSISEQFFAAIAEGRGVEGGGEAVREAASHGPFLAAEASERGLVDGLLYRDQVYDRVAELLGRGSADKVPLLFLGRYAAKRGKAKAPHAKGTHKVALITATGTIHRGESSREWTGVATSIGSDTLCRQIRAATADKKVRAIVLSVDSRGGSAVASDHVAREVRRARDAGKKVVALMGNVAASGGYYISMNADRIVASGTTITGSIGVVHGKLVFSDAYDKLGVDWGVVERGDNARMFSHLRTFTEQDRRRMEAMIDAIYADFTGKAALGRGMSPDAMEEVARGRVWTGAEAQRRGLVDELGGLDRAVEVVKDLLGLAEKDTVRLVPFPSPKSPVAALLAGPAKNTREQDRRGAAACVVPVPTAATLPSFLPPLNGASLALALVKAARDAPEAAVAAKASLATAVGTVELLL